MSAYGRALLAQFDADDLDELRRLLAGPRMPQGEESITAGGLLAPLAAAELVGVNVETIRRAVRSGALKSARAGRAVRIDPVDLEAWLNAPRQRQVSADRPGRRRPAGRRPMADALATAHPKRT